MVITRKDSNRLLMPRGPFFEAPGNYRARQAVLFPIPDGNFKTFESYTVKFSAKKNKVDFIRGQNTP